MRKLYFLCLILLGACTSSALDPNKSYKVGLCVVATGPYIEFAKELIDSGRENFCKGHQVTYFVFTDGALPAASDVVVIPQKRLGWPYDTLKRFHVYEAHKEELAEMDYLFAIDADMRFVAPVGNEILSKSVAVSRDVGKHRTYERNKKSQAYVSKKKAQHYFAGAFYGGERKEFFKILAQLIKQVDTDLGWDFIAICHDESHLNRYFLDHPPTQILNTSYCYPQDWDLPYEKKIMAMTKVHKDFQVPLEKH